MDNENEALGMKADVIVLGAGIVGVSTALHLRRRGVDVLLLDRRGPGEETSYGNAGVVDASALLPLTMPRDLAKLAAFALNRRTQARWDPKALRTLFPFLWRYWVNSAPDRAVATARTMRPLLDRAVAEHDALAKAAGVEGLFRRTGYLAVFRSEGSFAETAAERALAGELGVGFQELDQAAVLALEPNLHPTFARAIHWTGSTSVASPGDVTRAYARLFEAEGGRIAVGDARSLKRSGAGWHVETQGVAATADAVVVALGPWSGDVLAPLGITLPFAVKRGYHMHYSPEGNAALARPIVDVDAGYLLAPMNQGIRLTTAVEFADRDSAPTPVQLDQVEPIARSLFPLAARREASPWMGRRPCLPDSLPVIGRVPGLDSLVLAYGHNHYGFTLGPVTGRVVAELMTGSGPSVDLAPFSAGRFGVRVA